MKKIFLISLGLILVFALMSCDANLFVKSGLVKTENKNVDTVNNSVEKSEPKKANSVEDVINNFDMSVKEEDQGNAAKFLQTQFAQALPEEAQKAIGAISQGINPVQQLLEEIIGDGSSIQGEIYLIPPMDKESKENLKNAIAEANASPAQKEKLNKDLSQPLEEDKQKAVKAMAQIIAPVFSQILPKGEEGESSDLEKTIESIVKGEVEVTKGDYIALQILTNTVDDVVSKVPEIVVGLLPVDQNDPELEKKQQTLNGLLDGDFMPLLETEYASTLIDGVAGSLLLLDSVSSSSTIGTALNISSLVGMFM